VTDHSGRPHDLALRATLLDLDPPVWRRVRMPAGATLADLHETLQALFNWHERGLHQFTTLDGYEYTARAQDPEAPEDVLDSRGVSLSAVLPQIGDRVLYEYHFNDEWEVDVVRERDPRGPRRARPFLVDGGRASPPEECGGPEEYEDALRAFADPAHAEHAELAEWLPPGFDVEVMDGAAIRARLAALAAAPGAEE
jgi:hypothetical protein